MLGHQFYHGIIRKYVVAFGSLFNDITILREDRNNSSNKKLVRVPISYGPKEKFLVRLRQDPNLDQDIAISAPRLGFNLDSLAYNPERKLNKIHKNVSAIAGNNSSLATQYMPVPYDFDFTLNAFVRNAEDGTRILEQILPFFAPEFSVTIDSIPEMGLQDDIFLVLNSVDSQEEFEGNFDTRRSIIWNLSFTMRGFLYGPVRRTEKVIREANVSTYSDTTANAEINSSIITEPFIDGVDKENIDADDDFGFSTTIL